MSPNGDAEERIDWQRALELLASGSIVLVGQTHSRRVNLTDDSGRRYVTEEPQIDAIIQAINDLPEETRDRIALLSE